VVLGAQAFRPIDAGPHYQRGELLPVDALRQRPVIDPPALGEDAKREGVHDDRTAAQEDVHGGVFTQQFLTFW
jgi:hypothetical protein